MNKRPEPLFYHSYFTNGQRGTQKGAPLHKSSGKWKVKPPCSQGGYTKKTDIQDWWGCGTHWTHTLLVGRSVATTVENSKADFIFTLRLGNSIHTPNSNTNMPSSSGHSSTTLHRPALHTPKHPAPWSGHTDTVTFGLLQDENDPPRLPE